MNEETKKEFYAVAGKEGYGVYDDLYRLANLDKYVKRYKVEEATSFNEAKRIAKEMFDCLQLGCDDCYIEEINRRNWFYRKQLMSYEEYMGYDVKQPKKPSKKLVKPFTINVY